MVAVMSATLPPSVDLFALSKYKSPGNAMMLRESLFWRAEELARNAVSAIEAGDLVAGALLSRAVMETTAALVYLHKLVETGIKGGVTAELNTKIVDFLTGSKVWEEMGDAVSVMKMIDVVNKLVPGFRGHYDTLSEFAHPNWLGVHGAYGIIDQNMLTVSFVRGGRNPEANAAMIAGMLAAALGLTMGYYDFVGEKLVPFAEAVAGFHDAELKAGNQPA